MSKYKVGDKVKIVRTGGLNPVARGRYIGEVVTIKSVNPNAGFTYGEHYGVDGNSPFIYFENELEPYVEEKKMFTKSDLKTGMFGVLSNGDKFVVVNDHLVYQDDGYDHIATMFENDGAHDYIDKVWDGIPSFRMLDRVISGTANYGTLVYDRERDTKKLYNGKVVCVDNSHNEGSYTVGKIYQFVDGTITLDRGNKLPLWDKIYCFEDWANYTSSKFIELVE
jgi:hypothetical protein